MIKQYLNFFINASHQSVFILSFEDVKANFVLPLKDKKAQEKSSVEFDCTLTISTNDVHWFLNEVELHPTEDVEIIKEGTERRLILKDVHPQQSGQVTVRVGDRTSTANLIVEGGYSVKGMASQGFLEFCCYSLLFL